MSEGNSEAQNWPKPPIGSPCWMEIPVVDVAASKKFYSSLFPTWDFKPATKEYPEEEMAGWKFAGPSGLSGGIRHVSADCKTSEQGNGVGMTVYFFVESIEETQKRVEELGGTTIGKKEAAGDHGQYIYFKDVDGNRFGVYQLQN